MTKIWRWLLFLTAITGLISNVSSLRATSLIFGRGPAGANGTTTTAPTTIAPLLGDAANLSANASTTAADDEYIQPNEEEGGVTRPPLTGIPQIDYVWDPNLPRELNGYNLSTYPFLSLVPDPDEIDFKCDGLHDGFYASLKYSCQLYHHCIYGIRHDFLCANFTAFDQKTFICQFVSEVNCKASPKYFFRNDALYVAATTTSTTTTTIAPPITQAPQQVYERPRPRRPLLRRRPQQADYYEEDYEDDYIDTRPARRRPTQLRARTRRPEYDDYDGTSQSQGRRYSDDTYADRRPNRNRDPAYEDIDDEVDEPVRPRNRNNGGNRRIKGDSDRKRIQNDDRDTQRPLADDRRQKPRRKQNNEKRPKPKPQRYEDDEEDTEYDDRPQSGGNRFQEPDSDVPKVTPTGGGSSLFSKPRAPPRISRPVPTTEKKKFEYVPKNVKPASNPAVEEAEYDEDYEEPASPIPPVERVPPPRRPISKKKPLVKAKQPDYQEEEDDIEEDIAPVVAPRNNLLRSTTSRNTLKRPSRTESRSNKPVEIYAEDDVEDDAPAPPAVVPRNSFRSSILRNRVNQQQKQEEGRASQRRPVVENYPEDENEDDSIAPIQNNPNPRPQLHRNKNAARPSNSAPQSELRLNRRPEGSNKFRGSFRTNTRESSSTTSTSTTTTALPEPVDSFEEEEYEDEEFDDVLPAEPVVAVPSRPTTIAPDNQYSKNKNHRFATNSSPEDRNPIQRFNSQVQSSKENNSSSQESAESGEQSSSVESSVTPVREARPIVRVIKRPFLPSRGGNPYLPRGLKPLGPIEQEANDSSEQTNNPSSISGPRLSEFHPSLVSQQPEPVQEYSTTTEAPRFVETNPRAKLEEILSSDLDETLNDALNPTLKPLSRSSPIGFSFKYSPSYYEQPIDRSDAPVVKINPRGSTSYYGETHHQHQRSAPSAPAIARPATDFYADYEY